MKKMNSEKINIVQIQETLKTSLRRKLLSYNPEPASMPFHTRLLGKDRLALYAFIHSLNTNFGTTIFEPVAIELAKNRFSVAKSQVTAGDKISANASKEIQKIMRSLSAAESEPDKLKEIEAIRRECDKGKNENVRLTKVDIYLENKVGEKFLFDLKTAKPNAGGFKEFKRTLLEWVAAVLAEDPKAKVNTIIAIPYNPYEPEPYNRWTIRGMLDLERELMVGKEFWDFIGGEGAYEVLLDCFEKVGIELKNEIDEYFKRFTRPV